MPNMCNECDKTEISVSSFGDIKMNMFYLDEQTTVLSLSG